MSRDIKTVKCPLGAKLTHGREKLMENRLGGLNEVLFWVLFLPKTS
jgi:hypothetical protein